MRIPKTSTKRLKQISQLNSALWFLFKAAGIGGLGILTLGLLVSVILDVNEDSDQLSPLVFAIPATVWSLGGLALALNFLLEGYVYAFSYSHTGREIITGTIWYIFGAAILAVHAFYFALAAFHYWMEM